jgi:hypothetical protein
MHHPAEIVVYKFSRSVENGTGWQSGGRLCWRATCQGIAGCKLIEAMTAAAEPETTAPPVRSRQEIGSMDLPMLDSRSECRERSYCKGTQAVQLMLSPGCAQLRLF